MSWWSKASDAQRLAQIDAGIEVGMTCRQVAMASRTTLGVIRKFASEHDRHFPSINGSAAPTHKRRHRLAADRAAFVRGDRINLWGNTEAQDEFALDEVGVQ